MKKVVTLAVVLCMLVFGYVVGMPIQSFAETNQSEVEVELAASKQVTVYVDYGLNDSIAGTYPYNVGGWLGLLSYAGDQPFGDKIRVYYSGTVYCSGPCAMEKELLEE